MSQSTRAGAPRDRLKAGMRRTFRLEKGTHAADHCSTSWGWVLMAALVNCFKMSGSSGGMLICWAQYMVSGGGIAAGNKQKETLTSERGSKTTLTPQER